MAKPLSLPYLATAAIAGVIFGAGLYISGMLNPLKVLRFLDFTAISARGWDPTHAGYLLSVFTALQLVSGLLAQGMAA